VNPQKTHDDLAITIDPIATSIHKENNLEVASGLGQNRDECCGGQKN